MIRNLALITAFAIATASSFGAPAIAGDTLRPAAFRLPPGHILCVPPKVMTKECLSWGPAGPGQLFGPCLKYAYQCETPSQIQ